ncbi:uncharacterized protein N7459_004440 [Penicillium hispanicum]|uniref:uncharacterized protein n=1 Tax=Penicillium hispanicum TaxID=1080232 RepID=UPI0025422A8E|nr:uncharacterized protein N7459_004440 [Penicillium hispanicum]KAJ5584640.1 hypothetical protein N7459_004440 [Penicillium hispanicum]
MSGIEQKTENGLHHEADSTKPVTPGLQTPQGEKHEDKHHHHHFFHHHKEGEHRPSQAEKENAEWNASRHYDHALKNSHGAGVGFEE